jgi:hypothetical protein
MGKAATGIWRSFFNCGLHNLYSSRNIVRVVQSMKMVRLGHVARIGEKINT